MSVNIYTFTQNRIGDTYATHRSRAKISNLFEGIALPFLLVACGQICGGFATEGSLAFGSGFGACVTLWSLVSMVFRKGNVNTWKLVGNAVLMGYSLTTFWTWINLHNEKGGLEVYFGYQIASLCHAEQIVLTVAAVLLFVGELFGGNFSIDIDSIVEAPGVDWLLAIGWAIVVGAFFSGRLAYMGAAMTGEFTVNPVNQFIFWIIPPLYGLILSRARSHKISAIPGWAWWLMFLAMMVLIVPLGRRIFISSILVAGLSMRFARFRPAIPSWKVILIGAAVLFGIYFASLGFTYLRYARWQFSGDEQPSLQLLVTTGYGLYMSGSLTVTEDLRVNANERGFIIGFLADLLHQTDRHRTAGGDDLVNSLYVNIPRVLWPDKDNFLPPSEEDLANSIFGTDYPDQANSLLTNGAIDFGSFGAICYPLATTFLMASFIAAAKRFLPTLEATICFLAHAFVVLDIEGSDFSGYVGFWRNSVAFLIVIIVLRKATRLVTHHAVKVD